MGGLGSGRLYSNRGYVDTNLAIDIRTWKRKGTLMPGTTFTWHWLVNDEEQAKIRVRVEDNGVVLNYNTRFNGGDWIAVELTVTLTYTPCNYGGERVWFSCPVCNRRAAKLFVSGKYFVCSKCTGQLYESQSDWSLAKLHRKGHKLSIKLGADRYLFGAIPNKPKGMHWKTYERLNKEAETTYMDAVRLEDQIMDSVQHLL